MPISLDTVDYSIKYYNGLFRRSLWWSLIYASHVVWLQKLNNRARRNSSTRQEGKQVWRVVSTNWRRYLVVREAWCNAARPIEDQGVDIIWKNGCSSDCSNWREPRTNVRPLRPVWSKPSSNKWRYHCIVSILMGRTQSESLTFYPALHVRPVFKICCRPKYLWRNPRFFKVWLLIYTTLWLVCLHQQRKESFAGSKQWNTSSPTALGLRILLRLYKTFRIPNKSQKSSWYSFHAGSMMLSAVAAIYLLQMKWSTYTPKSWPRPSIPWSNGSAISRKHARIWRWYNMQCQREKLLRVQSALPSKESIPWTTPVRHTLALNMTQFSSESFYGHQLSGYVDTEAHPIIAYYAPNALFSSSIPSMTLSR